VYLNSPMYGHVELGHETILHAMLDYIISERELAERKEGGTTTARQEKKIVSLVELKEKMDLAKSQGKRIVHCHGVFDLLHPGHINYFAESKKRGDLLYVTVIADQFVKKGPHRPYFNEQLRLSSIAALADVDYVVLNKEEGPWTVMKYIQPHVYTKGESDKEKLNDPTSGLSQDQRILNEFGGKIIFTSEVQVHSTDVFRAFGFES